MAAVYLSEQSKASPVVIMQVTCADGSVCSLYIGDQDDASELALKFITQLGLPENLKERVEGQIIERRNQYFENARQQLLQQQQQGQGQSEGTPQSSSRAGETSGANVSPAEAAYYNAQANWQEDINNNKESPEGSPFGKLKKSATMTPASASKSGTPGGDRTMLKSSSFYSSKGSAVSKQKPLPNQAAFDRMYDYSKHKAQRREQMKTHTERERQRIIESSTFK
jgi:hypothetical protein